MATIHLLEVPLLHAIRITSIKRGTIYLPLGKQSVPLCIIITKRDDQLLCGCVQEHGCFIGYSGKFRRDMKRAMHLRSDDFLR